jgi:Putative auto-transporter adhesin, head GIN domain
MKRVIPVLLILVAVAIAVSLAWFYLAWSFRGTGGDGLNEKTALPPFSRIVIDGYADVTLVQGDAESASVEASSKNLPRVRAEVSGGTLTIANARSRRWWTDFFGGGARPARVTVTFRELESISASGAVKLRAEGLKTERLRVSASGATSIRIAGLETKELSVSGSGAMKIEFDGRATDQKVAISGAGDYRAGDLQSDDARVSVSGAGRVVVQVANTLNIGLSGAGSVEYYGNPKVTQQISGAGRVKRRDAGTSAPAIAQASASGLNNSGIPVSAARSACTPGTRRMSVTRQSRSRSTSMDTTSSTRSSA